MCQYTDGDNAIEIENWYSIQRREFQEMDSSSLEMHYKWKFFI